MLKQRVITAIILAVLFLSAVFYLNKTGWAVLVALMVLQGAREWVTLAGMAKMAGKAYIAILLAAYVAMLAMHEHLSSADKFQLQMAVYGAATLFWLLLVPLWLKNIWRTRNQGLLAVIGALLLLPTALAMLDLRAAGPWWLLAVMALVWMADIAAYFAGRKFGKHKLAPNVSPGKTWEGAAGAMVGVLLYMLLVLWQGGMLNHIELLVLAMFGVAISIIGDLFESAIKRQAGMKDSGTLLPGHGGLLDRIDALTSTLPISSMLLIILNFIK
ncbi:MAG TPA: phosphatidate cytidylyltransferase [Pseudomonadales bacterium]